MPKPNSSIRPRKRPQRRPLWIIKAGSQMVIAGGPRLIQTWMRQTAELDETYGIDVIWVTSGAIATARRSTEVSLLKTPAHKTSAKLLSEKQALSALGQPMVMNLYNVALAKLGRLGSQVLLTADDLANKKRRECLLQTLTTLISWGVLPILNENDAVSTEEIQFGDNDRLSALVAGHMKADRLILLTDVDGLYDADPKQNPDATLVRDLQKISARLISSLTSDTSSVGTGGMLSKILAAKIAQRDQIVTHLVRGDHPNAILKIAQSTTSAANAPRAPGTTIGIT